MSQESKKIQLKINDLCVNLSQKSLSFKEKDPLKWLQAQEEFPKFFWKSKIDGSMKAACGALMWFPSAPIIQGSSSVFLFGGGSPNNKGFPWQHFPTSFFFLPKRFVNIDNKNSQLILYGLENSAVPNWQSISHSQPTLKIATPSYEEWEKVVFKAFETFKNSPLKKVVPARLYLHQKDSAIDPYYLLEELEKRNKDATFFLLQLDSQKAFLGATPEMLYARKGRSLYSEVVAGTRKISDSIPSNNKLKHELLESLKDSTEFGIVKEQIINILSPLTNSIRTYKKDKVIQSGNLLHRYNRIRARLSHDIPDAEIITKLHPTAAITGYPKELAAEFIKENEAFGRGWYASPIGYISKNQSELAVAIRSALLENEKAYLFSAAGIVEGSVPSKEWEELDAKISLLKSLL